MYSRDSIQREIQQEASAVDRKRREFLAKLRQHTEGSQETERNIILYAMKPPHGAIWVDDVQGFMAAQHELKGDKLDLIIHSSGGSSEAAEQIVSYLRQKYSHIRVIVPLYAMSAATMIACAADEIVMGRQSALGPIDPQFLTGTGPMPAHAIVKEFELAVEQIKKDSASGGFLGAEAQCLAPRPLRPRLSGDRTRQRYGGGLVEGLRKGRYAKGNPDRPMVSFQ